MPDSRRQESLAFRGGFGFALQVVLRLRGLILIPILLRVLPPAEVGVMNLGNAFAGWATPLLLLGLNTGFALRVVHLTGRAVRPALATVLAFSATFSIAATLLMLLTVHLGLLRTTLAPLGPVLIPIGLLAVGTATRELAIVLPQVRQELSFIGQNSILMDFGGALLAITFVLMGFGAYGGLLGPAITSAIAAALAATFSLRTAEGPWAFDPDFLKSALRAALPVVPLALALWILQSSDYFFISHFDGTVSVAIYALAYNLASPVLMAMAAMNLTYLPTCVEILGRGRVEFARFIDASTRIFALGGVAAVALSVVGGPLVTSWLAGPGYRESGRLLPVIVGAYVLFSLAQLQQFVPGAMTQNLAGAARAHLWAAAFNIVANFALVPSYGYWGAAWATLVSYGLALVLLLRDVRTLLPETLWQESAWRFVAAAAASSALGLFLRPFTTSALALVAFSMVSMVGTALLAAGLGLVSRADLAQLRDPRDKGSPA